MNDPVTPCGWCRTPTAIFVDDLVWCRTPGCPHLGSVAPVALWNRLQAAIVAARKSDYEAGWYDYEDRGGNWKDPDPKFDDYIAGKAG